MQNPHYTPEVSTKTTIVNFAVTAKGLEDQFLGVVFNREEAKLEEDKQRLVTAVTAGKRKLVELEDKILSLLRSASGSLLDDETLINTLNSSKTISEEVKEQLKVSEENERKIDATREGYRPVAARASILFFVLNDLALVDPMYQFSLDAYTDLFKDSIVRSRDAKSVDNLQERIASMCLICCFDTATLLCSFFIPFFLSQLSTITIPSLCINSRAVVCSKSTNCYFRS
jgi:dynein heavy chain